MNKSLSYPLIYNQEENQYEFHIDDSIAKIEYIKAQNKIFLTHTEVPKELEGLGIGSSLIKKVLGDIQKQELTLVPLCPFVASYIKQEGKLLMKIEFLTQSRKHEQLNNVPGSSAVHGGFA